MSAIEVQDLRKTYGATVAVDGVSFQVEAGEVVGFLGPNGAGKTTTMKILTGSLTPTAGHARVDGLDVVEQSLAVRRKVGYLPENAPVYRDMRVRDYLAFVCSVREITGAERASRIDWVAERVGLTEVLRRPIAELSKGYRQRVGLAQALIHDPPILVLDEPTTGLDPNQIVEIRDLIREVGQTRTVLLSTHILGEVQAVCSRVVIVSAGRIVGVGTPAEIASQATGGSRVEVLLRADADPSAALAALPGVQRVEESAGEGAGTWGRALLVQADHDPREAVFDLAVRQGWVLLELRREGLGLEAAFRALTRGPS